VRELWKRSFHQEGSASARRRRSNPRRKRVRGLGEEAFWVGDPRLGGLYVCARMRCFALRSGGAEGMADKLRKLKPLARKALSGCRDYLGNTPVVSAKQRLAETCRAMVASASCAAGRPEGGLAVGSLTQEPVHPSAKPISTRPMRSVVMSLKSRQVAARVAAAPFQMQPRCTGSAEVMSW